MAKSLSSLLFGTPSQRELVEVVVPRRTFADVILPRATRQALQHALTQIEKHDLMFRDWGLAERHSLGVGMAFNFAGPPGTGKTICAEALAHRLGRQLFVVRYADLESMWMGSTGKNVVSVFEWAEEADAVLFFDEADAIAGRRSTALDHGFQREANAVVNILLREMEAFPGVVIFATNLARNFDPAFERRIHTHILFERPGAAEREAIWRVQLHPTKTPLAPDVDFRALAEAYAVNGGAIKNAVLKAAQMALGEPGPDREKRIHQRHFEAGMEAVLAGKQAMGQSLFAENGEVDVRADEALLAQMVAHQTTHRSEVEGLGARLQALEAQTATLGARLRQARQLTFVALGAALLTLTALLLGLF